MRVDEDERENVTMRMMFIQQETQLYLYTGSPYQSISSSLECNLFKDAHELHNVDITRLAFQVPPTLPTETCVYRIKAH